MKKILGLDLGTGSIGWALVNEAETKEEKSSIVKLGVRVNPLTVDEQNNFESGKSITTTADRTQKRGMRRNLQRYKLRRAMLMQFLKDYGLITDDTILCEEGNATTFQTYRLRAKAAKEEVSLEELARVLLMINKKRGYKSSRKSKSTDEGQLIDGMSIAKVLYDEKMTPGQYVLRLLQSGKKYVPDFYRSDLQSEFDRVWNFQQTFHPDILTDEFRKQIEGRAKQATAKVFLGRYSIYTADNKEKDKRLQAYKWRCQAIERKLTPEELAFVICEINGAINNSSGYLGAISDRSKELYFRKQTVGQYLMAELDKNPHFSLKNKAFYRQDYLDEFETVWTCQAQFHPELTDKAKRDIRDIAIFYQRPLKSKKGMLDNCTLEERCKVCPKSSPLFQEFKIWQRINDIEVADTETGDKPRLDQEEKELLFREANVKDKLSKRDILKLLYRKPKGLDLNFAEIDGNHTMATLYRAYQNVMTMSGHEVPDFSKTDAATIEDITRNVFQALGANTDFLTFDAELEGHAFDQQPAYQLWHVLYSYEGDNSKTGTDSLINKVQQITGLDREYAAVIAGVTFVDDYGSLSSKAMRRLLPYMKQGNDYREACSCVGYSERSLTKEELDAKVLVDHLQQLPKNALRNPVVEKILNQMINVVNEIVDTYGKPDEVRIELARELKKSAKEREDMSRALNQATTANEKYRETLQSEFGIQHVSRNDIIRYRLYLELESNGFKTLYTNTYIPKEKLFSKEFDIEHIIPQARLFDDSFSNKTLEVRSANIEKGSQTAWDYVLGKYNETGAAEYRKRIDDMLKNGSISRAKHDKLLMTLFDIPQDFIDRDLRNSQYIAKKAREILEDLVRRVIATTGSITDRLRDDWQLVDVMQELNWDKYHRLGLTETFQDKDGRTIRRIKDWTKRNDHRHHAMDALTIAFTKEIFIQYLNNLNARSDKSGAIYAIEQTGLRRDSHGRLRFLPPMPLDEFRAEAKKQLQAVLVSIKAKNKVMTRNTNRTRKADGTNARVQLTPRGQLHNETIYGSMQRYDTREAKVNGSFDADTIALVAKKVYREALLARLQDFGGDAKKAFTGKNSLDKCPLWIDEAHTQQVPERVKLVELTTIYPIRKAISPDLKIDKVLDKGIRDILAQRLADFGGDAKKAFSNLDENPIWLNREKGISIKRVTISGIANATALHEKRDQHGNLILDQHGKPQPVDFVNTGNNHHVAIFRDDKGNLQEHVVSFLEATERVAQGLPAIDHHYNEALGWQFLFTMKQNEYFVFPNDETGFNPMEVDLMNPDNYPLISPNLYRVQYLASKDYMFRHHLETNVAYPAELKGITWIRLKSTGVLDDVMKVRVNHIGQIVAVGEY